MATRTQTKKVAVKGDPKVLKALAKFSQLELARRTGLTGPYLSMVLAGKRMPRMESMMKLSRNLGVSVELFYRHLLLKRGTALPEATEIGVSSA